MMDNNNRSPQDIDPGLLEKINLLEQVPERDPQMAAQTRGKFLAEVEKIPLTGSSSGFGWLLGLFGFNSPAGASTNNGKRKLAISTLAAILLVVVVLFGGASATAYASQSALPGDALYPLKTSLEQTQITLANDAYNQAKLHLEFAQRRLDEIKELLAQGRTNDVEFAANEFEHYIQEAMQAAQIVQTADPERGAELNKLVSQALLDYASALKSVLDTAPAIVKPIVEKALFVSQSGAGDEVEIFGVVARISETELEIEGVMYRITELTEFEDFIQAGDMVKIHVIKTQDGAMVVREIEISSAFDDNSNESGVDNSDDSIDDNGLDNESGDDSNENESGDNLNENESNENSSGNENGSDDHANENDSNSNDNDNDSDDDQSGSRSGNQNDEDESDDNDNESDGGDGNSNENNSESEDNDNDSEDENSNDDD
jgi:hypothetical protein